MSGFQGLWVGWGRGRQAGRQALGTWGAGLGANVLGLYSRESASPLNMLKTTVHFKKVNCME